MTQALERPAAGLEGVEFLDAEGLADLDAVFEEEFNASDEHIEFVGGSTGSVSLSTSAFFGFPGELGEDPVSYTTAERPEK